MTRRVAVTGLGVVTPLGNDVASFWESLVAGRSGVDGISLFDASGFRVRIAAEVRDFAIPARLEGRRVRRLDRFALFGVAAALQAWTDAGLDDESPDPYDAGIIIGSSHGGETTFLNEAGKLLGAERASPSPLFSPRMLSNMAAAQTAIVLGLRGPSFGVSSACATGAHAIGEAAEMIRRGDAEVMLCGASEACISPLTLASDDALGALSRRNHAPTEASRPFDAGRDGFVLGEGAGVLVLEAFERARARGATIVAELVGYGATTDGFHETRPIPDGESAARAMQRALAKAGVEPAEVDAVFAHGASTRAGDVAETAAIKSALGRRAWETPVTAIKSMTGHLLGASGAVQAAAAVKAIADGILPPTINLTSPDPECDLDYAPGAAREADLSIVMSNAFGFGGHNACLVFRRPT